MFNNSKGKKPLASKSIYLFCTLMLLNMYIYYIYDFKFCSECHVPVTEIVTGYFRPSIESLC